MTTIEQDKDAIRAELRQHGTRFEHHLVAAVGSAERVNAALDDMDDVLTLESHPVQFTLV